MKSFSEYEMEEMGYADTKPHRQSQELRNRHCLLVAHETDSTSSVNVLANIVRQHLQWFPENRLSDSKLSVQHLLTLILVEKN